MTIRCLLVALAILTACAPRENRLLGEWTCPIDEEDFAGEVGLTFLSSGRLGIALTLEGPDERGRRLEATMSGAGSWALVGDLLELDAVDLRLVSAERDGRNFRRQVAREFEDAMPTLIASSRVEELTARTLVLASGLDPLPELSCVR